MARALFACLMLGLPSCNIPQLRHAEPGPALPETFRGITTPENSSQAGWHDFFDDPLLTALIDDALVGNQELKILEQEIQIANNEVRARRGEYLPFVTLGGEAGIEKPSRFSPQGAVEEHLEPIPGKSFPEPLPDFLTAANVSWELDIWRKLRNARDAAALRYLGTRDGRNYIVTRLVSEMAESYYELMALDNRMATLDQTIAIQRESLAIAQNKFRFGAGNELAVQRFEADIRKNESEKRIIAQDIIEVENRMNFLAGRYPQHIDRASDAYISLKIPTLQVGIPSQLLRNRADIRQAERQVAAAGLDVLVAKARFYPTLDLSAGVGLRAFNPRYIFSTPDSLIYHAAGGLVAPLINRAAIRADYLSANAEQLQSIYNYQRTVLNAYVEVVNHLSMVDNYSQSIELKQQQMSSLESAVKIAMLLFQNANAEYIEVLTAQRDFMEGRMVLIDTKKSQLSAVVHAYQALGGGQFPGVGGISNDGLIVPVVDPLELLPRPPAEASQG